MPVTNSNDKISVFDLRDSGDKQRWDKAQTGRRASFLQSSPWAGFQQSLGYKCHLVSGPNWSCLLIERKTPLGRYMLAPYGPTTDDPAAFANAITQLKAFGKQAGVDWLRLEPLVGGSDSPLPAADLRHHGGRLALHNVEPATTRILDLRPSPDELLAQISSTTRTFIHKNQREGLVSFKTSSQPSDMPYFAAMVSSVAKRKGVNFFSEEYFTSQAKLLMPAGMLYLELAYIKNQPVAGIMIHDYGQISSYTNAASLPEARQTSVSALLLWQAMLNAKVRGMEQLDLYGVAPEDAPPSHPWYGFSAFKKKFGGRLAEHAGTWDFPLTAKYRLYRLVYQAKTSVAGRR